MYTDTKGKQLPNNFAAPQDVASVTFHLHPDFDPHVITISEPPFQLSRSGWGAFDVGVEIVTTSGLKVETEHLLNLNDPFEVIHVPLIE